MRYFILGLLFIFSSELCFGQKRKKEDSKEEKKEKTYKDIVTEDAVSTTGLFSTHEVDGSHYFEIPDDLLNKEILIVSRISGFVKNLNFGGAGVKSKPQQVIRWQKIANKLALRSVSYNSVASFEDPIYASVINNNFEPIIMMFDIETTGENSSLIKVDPLFTDDIPMISAVNENQVKEFGIKGVDSKRSIITSMKSFPRNVEVRHILTYKGGSKLPDNQITGTMSVEMNQSFILLPDDPMEPRYYDDRVGYFSVTQTNYSLDDQRTEKERFITRWRLEPKDLEAYKRGELVEPIKPIVYYIDPATPTQWVPYLKQGVNDWQKAFEKVGFKNAIYALEAPTKEENPDWSPEDTRYSVIRYVSTDIQNAMGPHVHDPRTGEIIESDIIWYHNVMKLLRNWFFIQTAAINPEARGTNFKQETMGRLIRFVSAHEVGHTLGLPHNMGASVAYPVDSLRSPSFTKKMGTAPSIMDYARFNYVAQPEDGDVGLMPDIGTYDDWSILYGYKVLPDTPTKESERPVLNEMIKEHAGDPLYRYGRQRRLPLDPTAQTEDLGDDSMLASEYGIKNLKRIIPNLAKWTYEDGKDYSQTEELYNQVYNQFRRYMGHVVANVGGVIEINKTQDQKAASYTHVNKAKQVRAMQFLNMHIFNAPTWLVDAELTRNFEADGVLDRIKNLQSGVLNQLFNTGRMNRIIENETVNKANAYTLYNLFKDSESYVFDNLDGADSYKRNLQRLYIDKMESILMSEDKDVNVSDIKAAARGTLYSVHNKVKKAKGTDSLNAMHKLDLRNRIEGILDMRK